MGLFGRKKRDLPELSREESLSAKPVLNRLVKVERDGKGNVILHIPRRDTALVRFVSRVFKMSPYSRLTLDALGTFVIELCDGDHTVRQIVDKLSENYKLNKREAELSTSEFLRTLARRSIVALVIEEQGA
ncbi:MAG: PqqD family protein [Candidatus Brocadiaceae bacterium]|jgi:hypothetical protein